MTTEREVRKQLVEALEGLEDGWASLRLGLAAHYGAPVTWQCNVCGERDEQPQAIDHQPGCPVPLAYAALEAARALDEVKA